MRSGMRSWSKWVIFSRIIKSSNSVGPLQNEAWKNHSCPTQRCWESTNQSINQSINQSHNQSINQSINRIKILPHSSKIDQLTVVPVAGNFDCRKSWPLGWWWVHRHLWCVGGIAPTTRALRSQGRLSFQQQPCLRNNLVQYFLRKIFKANL